MRRVFFVFLLFSISTSGFSQESRRSARRGEAAGYSTREASVLSMMGWGFGLAIGIAALCALIDNHPTAAGGGGSNSH